MNNIIQKLRLYLQSGNRSAIAVFCLFATTIFAECILYHSFAFRSFGANLFSQPIDFFAFWLPKVAVACFIASFVFLTRYKSWTIILSIAINIWMIANLLYFRANDIFLTYEAITMAGKLKGTGGSLWLYMNWNYLYFFLITLIYTALFILVRGKARSWKGWLLTLLTSGLLSILGGASFYHTYKDNDIVRFDHLRGNGKWVAILPFVGEKDEVREYSKHYFFYHGILSHIHTMHRYRYKEQLLTLTPTEQAYIDSLLPKQDSTTICPEPNSNLIVFFVESMETWPLDITDANGKQYTPHFNQFLHQRANLYASRMKPQVRHGVSGDGQLIINTGMLPLHSGAACMMYGDNAYPNFASQFSEAVLFNPQTVFWNKDVAFRSYGYTSIVEPDTITTRWSDAQLFDSLSIFCKRYIENERTDKVCLFMLPLAPHTPFLAVERTEEQNGLHFPDDMPIMMRNYLTCLNYTDSCFGSFMNEFQDTEFLQHSTIVVTGDHTVFRDMLMHELHDYAAKENLPFASGKNHCPFMISSPYMNRQIVINDEVMQIDMFPTITSLCQIRECTWSGFGSDLSQPTQTNSSLTEQELFTLSDKLIRQNYFSKPQD